MTLVNGMKNAIMQVIHFLNGLMVNLLLYCHIILYRAKVASYEKFSHNLTHDLKLSGTFQCFKFFKLSKFRSFCFCWLWNFLLKNLKLKDKLQIWGFDYDFTPNMILLCLCSYFDQKQPPRGDPRKRCSENMQQMYWRTPMVWVFSCQFAAYFQNTFLKNSSGRLLLFDNNWNLQH